MSIFLREICIALTIILGLLGSSSIITFWCCGKNNNNK